MRKLACVSVGFSAAVFISYYLLSNNLFLLAGVISLALTPIGLFFSGNMRKRIIIVLISMAAGFVWCSIYQTVISADVTDDYETNVSEAQSIPERIAESITNKIGEITPDDVSPFLKALLVGKRGDLNNDTAVKSALTASGIIHVVTVSGMHISFLMGFLALVIKNEKLFAIYAIPVLFLFMAMTGFTSAVTRAGIMQVFLICAPLFNRESDSLTSLSAAMLFLLIADPSSCMSVGLQLSFAATLGIILFTTRINNAFSDFMRSQAMRGNKIYRKKAPKAIINYITSSFATTVGALIFTLPLCAVHFGYVSLISPITNLLTIGIVSLVFPAGLLASLLGFIHSGLGSVFMLPVVWAVRYIIAVSRVLASVPYAVVYSSSMHIMFWLVYVYVVFITLPLMKARLKQYLYPACIAVILLFAVILTSILLPSAPGSFVTAVDVGQGSCTVVSLENYTMVIDCGSISRYDAGERAHEYLQSIGCTSIDLLALTHFHEDHISGVEFLLSRINVSTLMIPDPESSYAAEDIINLARRSGSDIMYIYETLSIDIGGSKLFVYPPLGSGDENERGLSFLIKGDITALITGDMNSSIERALLRFADLPKLDLLVVGHHGSRESTSEELLLALSPNMAVITVGRNSFGHPHPDVLQRLAQYGVTVYRTDEMGHVTITN